MKKIILLLVGAMFTLALFATPVIIHVTPTGSADPLVDGSSWENAVSLERGKALSNANFSQSIDNQVWVKGGTYNLTDVFSLNANMALYGGFAGTETELSQRNWMTNQTIFNQTAAKMVIWGSGQISTGVFTDYDVLLDGFIFQGGRVVGAGGCGQLAQGTTLRNCISRNNSATTNSGAFIFKTVTVSSTVLASTKKVVLDNCLIVNNQSGVSPSVITATTVPSEIINCTIANNYNANTDITGALTGSAFKVYNSILYNNYNGTNLAKAFGNGTANEFTNNAWDLAASEGTRTLNTLLTTSPFVSPTSYLGAANGSDKLVSAIEGADFKLALGSACINAGNNGFATATTDLGGATRIQNTTVDMGCYESSFLTTKIIYVSPTGSSESTVQGTSWANAVSLGRGRALAATNSTSLTPSNIVIWMKSGTYDLTTAFNIALPMKIYGGFVGTETALSQRNWIINPTILNQTGANMVIFTNMEKEVLLDGLILQGGRPTTSGGCGVITSGTTLRNCIIRNNKTTTSAGALMVTKIDGATQKVIIDNCLIINNESAIAPQAVSIADEKTEIINTSIANNLCTTAGTTAALSGAVAYKLYNSIICNNYNVSTLAKSLSDNATKTVSNSAWDFEAVDGTKTNCISLSASPFVAATSYQGAANGSDKLLSAIESADFKLLTSSNCINTGDNSYATSTVDLAAQNRIQGVTVDMGCFESNVQTATLNTTTNSTHSLRVNGQSVELPNAAIGGTITVFNTNGAMVQKFVAQSTTLTIAGKGVFIIRINAEVFKVIL